MKSFIIPIFALSSLSQIVHGATVQLSDLASVAPAPPGSDHPPLITNPSLQPKTQLTNFVGSEISLPLGQVSHALFSLLTQSWVALTTGAIPPLSPSHTPFSYADPIFPLNTTITPSATSPNVTTAEEAGAAGIVLLNSLLSGANATTTVPVPKSQIILNGNIDGGTIQMETGGGPTGDQSLWATHLQGAIDQTSPIANFSSGMDFFNVALTNETIPATTVISLLFQLLQSLPLSRPSNGSILDYPTALPAGTVVQSQVVGGYVVEFTFVQYSNTFRAGWKSLADGLAWMLVKSAVEGRWAGMSAEFATMGDVNAEKPEVWGRVEVVEAGGGMRRRGVVRRGWKGGKM